MKWRLSAFVALGVCLVGCSEDCHKPRDTEAGLQGLLLTVELSSDEIALGETLDINLTARNPYDGPVDVTFGSTCQVGYWIYDQEEHEVGPFLECRPMVTTYHMDALEVRTFDMRWTAGGSINPGPHTLIAGFYSTWEQPSHRATPISITVLSKKEQQGAAWTGSTGPR